MDVNENGGKFKYCEFDLLEGERLLLACFSTPRSNKREDLKNGGKPSLNLKSRILVTTPELCPQW
jgi:hypothetical protein